MKRILLVVAIFCGAIANVQAQHTPTYITNLTDSLIRKMVYNPVRHASVWDVMNTSKVSILSPVLVGSSTVGYVWTATNISGAGSWQAAGGGGITNSAANTELMISDGTNAIGGKIFSSAPGNQTFGDGGLAGGTRTLTMAGSASNVSFSVVGKGSSYPIIASTTGITGNLYLAPTGIATDWVGGGSPFGISTFFQTGSTSSTGLLFSTGNVVTGTAGHISFGTGTISGGTEGAINIQTRATGKVGFFNATAVTQRTVNTLLVNNVTSGGTVSTIANYTDLSVYGNDAAAIRNNFFRLTEKVLKLEQALRDYGIVVD